MEDQKSFKFIENESSGAIGSVQNDTSEEVADILCTSSKITEGILDTEITTTTKIIERSRVKHSVSGIQSQQVVLLEEFINLYEGKGPFHKQSSNDSNDNEQTNEHLTSKENNTQTKTNLNGNSEDGTTITNVISSEQQSKSDEIPVDALFDELQQYEIFCEQNQITFDSAHSFSTTLEQLLGPNITFDMFADNSNISICENESLSDVMVESALSTQPTPETLSTKYELHAESRSSTEGNSETSTNLSLLAPNDAQTPPTNNIEKTQPCVSCSEETDERIIVERASSESTTSLLSSDNTNVTQLGDHQTMEYSTDATVPCSDVEQINRSKLQPSENTCVTPNCSFDSNMYSSPFDKAVSLCDNSFLPTDITFCDDKSNDVTQCDSTDSRQNLNDPSEAVSFSNQDTDINKLDSSFLIYEDVLRQFEKFCDEISSPDNCIDNSINIDCAQFNSQDPTDPSCVFAPIKTSFADSTTTAEDESQEKHFIGAASSDKTTDQYVNTDCQESLETVFVNVTDGLNSDNNILKHSDIGQAALCPCTTPEVEMFQRPVTLRLETASGILSELNMTENNDKNQGSYLITDLKTYANNTPSRLECGISQPRKRNNYAEQILRLQEQCGSTCRQRDVTVRGNNTKRNTLNSVKKPKKKRTDSNTAINIIPSQEMYYIVSNPVKHINENKQATTNLATTEQSGICVGETGSVPISSTSYAPSIILEYNEENVSETMQTMNQIVPAGIASYDYVTPPLTQTNIERQVYEKYAANQFNSVTTTSNLQNVYTCKDNVSPYSFSHHYSDADITTPVRKRKRTDSSSLSYEDYFVVMSPDSKRSKIMDTHSYANTTRNDNMCDSTELLPLQPVFLPEFYTPIQG